MVLSFLARVLNYQPLEDLMLCVERTRALFEFPMRRGRAK